MTIRRKIIYSFLLAAFLITCIIILDYTRIFNFIETRFHDPVLRETVIRQTAKDAEILNDILSDMKLRFYETLFLPAVHSSFHHEQSNADFNEISMLFMNLMKTVPGLSSVRLVDTDGIKIRFSTNPSDRISDQFSDVYRNYSEDLLNIPFSAVYVTIQEQSGLVIDKSNNKIIFSFPVSEYPGIQQGIALFSVSAGALAEAFAVKGKSGYGGTFTIIDEPPGFIFENPAANLSEEIINEISEIWTKMYRSIIPLTSSDETILLVSVRMGMGFYLGRIINEHILIFSQSVKIFLFIVIFISLFLIILFLLNIPQLSSAVYRKCHGKDTAGKDDTDIEKAPDMKKSRGLLSAALPLAAEPVIPEEQEVTAEVIFEQDGIPYIDNDTVSKRITNTKINSNFVKLVDSVINKDKDG
ncbi:MAG: hypothetical protein FWG89_10535 [Treponema sp.]|nr:hypothetical protein [Treponema sp.]